MRYRDLARLLRSRGCEHVRTVGSHERWTYQGECFTTVPAHRTIAAGTLRSIARDLAPCLGEGWLQ